MLEKEYLSEFGLQHRKLHKLKDFQGATKIEILHIMLEQFDHSSGEQVARVHNLPSKALSLFHLITGMFTTQNAYSMRILFKLSFVVMSIRSKSKLPVDIERLRAAKDYTSAFNLVKKNATKLEGSSIEAIVCAEYAIEKGDLAQARSILTKILEKDPDNEVHKRLNISLQT
jgi:hypothetical protein